MHGQTREKTQTNNTICEMRERKNKGNSKKNVKYNST